MKERTVLLLGRVKTKSGTGKKLLEVLGGVEKLLGTSGERIDEEEVVEVGRRTMLGECCCRSANFVGVVVIEIVPPPNMSRASASTCVLLKVLVSLVEASS